MSVHFFFPESPVAVADYTVLSAAMINGLINNWPLENGVRQIPEGRPIVIQLGASFDGFDISGHEFSQHITWRGTGPYRMPYLASNGGEFGPGPYTSSDMTGPVITTGCSNMTFYGIYFDVSGYDFELNNVTDFEVLKCWFDGEHFPQNTINTNGSAPSNSECMTLRDTTRTTVKFCHFSHGSRAAIVIEGAMNTDLTIDGATFDHLRHDNIKIFGSTTRMTLRRLLRCRSMIRLNTQHTDFVQAQGGYHINAVFELIIAVYSARVNGADSSEQGLFLAGGDPAPVGNGSQWEGCIVRYCLMAGNHLTQIRISNDNPNPANPNRAYNNTVVPYHFVDGGVQRYSSPTINGFDVYERNLMVTQANRDRSGTGGRFYDWGSVDNNDMDFSQFGLSPDFSHAPDATRGLEWALPQGGASAGADWRNPASYGCSPLLEEQFVLGGFLSEAGWPCAGPADRQYNRNRLVPSAYTGEFDADGLNVGTVSSLILPASGLVRFAFNVG